jgi:hypothetical protein
MLTTNKQHAYWFMGLMTLFTIIGLLAGSPRSISFDSFGDFLRGFVSDTKTQLILGAIFADVFTGVGCAMRLGIFDIQKSAKFYTTNVLPYLLGFMLVWTATFFGFEFPTVVNDTIGSGAYAFIMAALAGSIADNIKRARMGASAPEDVLMIDAKLSDTPKG